MKRAFNRREFLTTSAHVAGAAALGNLVACRADRLVSPDGSIISSATTASIDVGNTLVEPQLLSSNGTGVVTARMTIATKPVSIAGRTVLQPVTYGGSFPAPTLWVRRGEWLNLQFTNRIMFDQLAPRGRYRPPRDTTTTNVHFHGLHVPPGTTAEGTADDVFLMIHRNETQQYNFRIPHDHPVGLHFYHPHMHGTLNSQMSRGAAGLLYVAGPYTDELRRRGIRQRLMMLQQAYIQADGRTLTFDDAERENEERALSLINGQLRPAIDIRPREPQVWSVCNGSTSAFYMLRLDGHVFDVIANDGLALPTVRTQETIALGPGKRTEFIVRGSSTPGTYEFTLDEYNQGVDTWPARVIGSLVVEGPAWMGAELPGLDAHGLPDLRGASITANRRITFDVDESIPEGEYGRFTMNGHPFGTNAQGEPDAGYVEWTSSVDDTEEWIIQNNTDQDHPFHVHTNPFQVVEITGSPQLAQLDYQDTVVVPRNGGTVRVRTRFTDFSGRILMHCHIIDHEDMGMMTSFRITD